MISAAKYLTNGQPLLMSQPGTMHHTAMKGTGKRESNVRQRSLGSLWELAATLFPFIYRPTHITLLIPSPRVISDTFYDVTISLFTFVVPLDHEVR